MKKTNTPAKTAPVDALPELSAIVVNLGETRQRLEAIAIRYDRETLADRLWIGVCCLAAQDRHAMDVKTQRSAAGKGNRRTVSRRDTVSEISPNVAHPQGFAGWLTNAAPWLNRATAYKYMDAARGAGLTAYTKETDLRQWVDEMLARNADLSLKDLVAAGRKLLPPPPEEKDGGPDYVQMTWDAIFALSDQTEAVLAHRDRMSPKQYERACAEAYRALRDLTGQPWAPADEENEHYVSILEDARRVR